MEQGANNGRPAGSGQPAQPGQTGPLPKPSQPAQPGQTGPLPKPAAAATRVGNFEILGKIGKGGMGTVFKARQVMMDRIVALKILPPHLARNKQFVVRFLREAQSAAKLSHPNIVGAFDAGVADGYNYFAMEFVDGQGLDRLIHESGGKLSEERALEIVRDVAKALDYAHSSGIIHRDIKPDNILISSDGTTKLADLGLARETGTSEMHLTQTGVAIGTPNYIAPEQVRGESDLDGRCDIYALGATLYHLVTGMPPYVGGTGTEVMSKHLTEPVPDARKINPAVSAETVALIRKSMAKTRKGRHATAKEFLDDAERILSWKKNPKLAPDVTVPSARRSQAPPPKSNKMIYMAGAAAAVIAIIVVAIAMSPSKEDQPQPKPPVETQRPDDAPAPPVVARPEPEPQPEPQPIDVRGQRRIELERVVKSLVEQGKYGAALKQIEDSASTVDSEFMRQLDSNVRLNAYEKFNALAGRAAATAAEGDFTKAKSILQEAFSFGIEGLTNEANKLIAQFSEEEKAITTNKKLDEIKDQFKALLAANKFAEAEQALKQLSTLDLPEMDRAMKAGMKAVEKAKKDYLALKLATYSKESDEFWAALKERKYGEAEAKMNQLTKKPEYMNDPEIAEVVKKDAEAVKLLQTFWTRVERGINSGAFVFGGTVVKKESGMITIETGPAGNRKKEVKSVTELTSRQAESYAKITDTKDADGQMMLGVFFLAEDIEHVKAMEAFENVPERSEYYRARLQEKYNEAIEGTAAKAWAQIVQAAEKIVPSTEKPDTSVGKLIAPYEQKYSQTAVYKNNQRELQDIRRRLVFVYKKWSHTDAETVQKETADTLGLPVEKEIKAGNTIIQLVLIPACEFSMGDVRSEDNPRHIVRISMPFYISKTEVTQEQWNAVMGGEEKVSEGNLPKEKVNWFDCAQFMKKLSESNEDFNFRFPTSAEWEHACRAGTASGFSFGDKITGQQANYLATSRQKAAKVASYQPNLFGLYDMHGNVAEWCSDWYQKGWVDRNFINPRGPHDGVEKVLKGGSWYHAESRLSSFELLGMKPEEAKEGCGLRLVAALPGLNAETDTREGGDRGNRRRQTFNNRPNMPEIEWEPGSDFIRGVKDNREVWSRKLGFPVGQIREALNWQVQSEDGRQTEVINPATGEKIFGINSDRPAKRITKEDIEKWLERPRR